MVNLHARKPLERGGRDEIVGTDADDRRIGVEPAKDRITDHGRHHARTGLGSRTTVQRINAPIRSSTPRQMKKGVYPIAATSAPMSNEKTRTPPFPHVPAIPATVATSLRLNRSDDIVITVTESVWCAKPPRHSSAIAVYGLWTRPTKAMPIISTA